MDMQRTPRGVEREVVIPVGRASLDADLALPSEAKGLVIFAHGSGSSRKSPRNRAVARSLRSDRLGTLLLDLLTRDEERVDLQTRHLRFDIPMLAERLAAATAWAKAEPSTRALPIGLFGASTGGAAALVAAAMRPDDVRAVVSRGGRPDLAGDALPIVRASTLLIVGGYDREVLELNREAMAQMTGPVELEVIPGATHLFEEEGALDQVARIAGEFFVRHLKPL